MLQPLPPSDYHRRHVLSQTTTVTLVKVAPSACGSIEIHIGLCQVGLSTIASVLASNGVSQRSDCTFRVCTTASEDVDRDVRTASPRHVRFADMNQRFVGRTSSPLLLRAPTDPDFVMETNTNVSSGLDVYMTETQKTTARIHKIDESLLYALLHQKTSSSLPSGYMVELDARDKGIVRAIPPFPSLNASATNSTGIGLTMWFDGLGNASATIFDSTRLSSDGSGVRLSVRPDTLGRRSLALELIDVPRNQTMTLTTDPQCSSALQNAFDTAFVAFSVDAGSRVVSAVVNGMFCDGGPQSWSIHPQSDRDRSAFQGWAYLPDSLIDINGGHHASSISAVLDKSFKGTVHSLRLYPRFLLTSEMIGAWRSRR